jgi:hypothetical protein
MVFCPVIPASDFEESRISWHHFLNVWLVPFPCGIYFVIMGLVFAY